MKRRIGQLLTIVLRGLICTIRDTLIRVSTITYELLPIAQRPRALQSHIHPRSPHLAEIDCAPNKEVVGDAGDFVPHAIHVTIGSELHLPASGQHPCEGDACAQLLGAFGLQVGISEVVIIVFRKGGHTEELFIVSAHKQVGALIRQQFPRSREARRELAGILCRLCSCCSVVAEDGAYKAARQFKVAGSVAQCHTCEPRSAPHVVVNFEIGGQIITKPICGHCCCERLPSI